MSSIQPGETVFEMRQKLPSYCRLTIIALAAQFPHCFQVCQEKALKILTDQPKEERMSCGQAFLNRYQQGEFSIGFQVLKYIQKSSYMRTDTRYPLNNVIHSLFVCQ